MIVFRYIASKYALALAAALGAMTALYLVVDLADRAKFYSGDGWLKAVLELYACKGAAVGWQLAPAALAFGGAVAISGLRRTGEITALRSLGRGPLTFGVPIAVVSLLAAGTLTALEDPVVVPANYRAEEITVHRFHRWGDWVVYHWARKWYRGRTGNVYHLGRIHDKGYADVGVYELDSEFRLKRRIDTPRMVPADDGAWALQDAVVRSFGEDGLTSERREPRLVERFPDDLTEFRVKTGRPSQLRRRELPDQIALRQKLGLPSREWELALHERRAYQLTGVPAALVGACLALRPRRRGHLTSAIAEGLGVTIVLWGMNGFARALTLGGHLDPWVGGWLPLTLACVGTLFAWRLARG